MPRKQPAALGAHISGHRRVRYGDTASALQQHAGKSGLNAWRPGPKPDRESEAADWARFSAK
jgi:hypothetical protein